MPSERVQRQIDRFLDEAEAAMARSDWATVRDRATNAVALDPDNADAQHYVAAADRANTGAGAAAATDPKPAPETLRRASTPKPIPSFPTSFVGGRYEVKRFLGEGGKKLVYLAHDRELDRDVAFALIKTEGLDAAGRQRIQREAQAMGRLGSHPHVVSVFDIGDEGGQPFIITELMGGGDVEGLIEHAPEHRLPLERALQIGIETCQGLEFAHAQGIVHRDLKPGNVWLTADGVAKIGDFGLAVATDRSQLTQAGMMVGTVSYMPPEQAIGGAVTPSSDLYSLGAMLYELVTGRPPFVGDESVAIITQHLNTPPVAPSWHVPGLPVGLETLILRLLEKDPRKRPATAAEVRSALVAVDLTPARDGEATANAATARPEPGTGGLAGVGGAGPSPLYSRTFVGREPELRQLQGAFDAALSGQGSLAMVVGEPGIGKTSICEQLATYVAVRGGRALVGHCYEEGSLSLPYLPFVEAMRSYVLTREPDALKQDLGTGAADVARIVSEVRDRVAVELRPAGDPEDDRWRLYQSVTSFLRNASAVQPLFILLEDLHDADRGSIDLLQHLARNLQGTRLLLVGTYRDVEVDRSHPLSGALAELRRGASFLRVPLRGLTIDEVQRMMSIVRGQEVPWSRAEAIHRQTEGNPLFVQEVLRYLVEEGIVVREGGHYALSDPSAPEAGIPEGLRDVVGKRLSRLSQQANQVLSMASVVGRDFGLDVLQRVAGLPEEVLYAALEEATERAVVEQRQAVGAVGFRFTHAFFRQTLYEEIFIPRRIRLHQQVGKALEEIYGRRLEEHAAELAEHFVQSTEAGDLEKALRYAELAADRAIAVFAYGEAVRHLEQALRTLEVLDPDNHVRRCDLLLRQAEAMLPLEDPGRIADTVAAEAFALAESLHDNHRAARAAVLACESLDRAGARGPTAIPAVRTRYETWGEQADRAAPPRTAERVYADIYFGAATNRAGRPGAGHVYWRRAVDLALQLDDNDLVFAAASVALGSLRALRDRDLVEQLAREVLARPRQGVRPYDLGHCLLSAGLVLQRSGEREAAEGLWREVALLGERTGDTTMAVRAMALPAYAAFMDGRLEEAAELCEAATARARELSVRDDFDAAWILFYLGRGSAEALEQYRMPVRPTQAARANLLAYLGRHDEAYAIREQFTEIDSEDDESAAGILLHLFEAAILGSDVDTVRALFSRLTPLAGHVRLGFFFEFGGSVARLLGDASVLLGNPAEARAFYQQALDVSAKMRFRPETALTRLALAELFLTYFPDERLEAQRHLDFAIEEFRLMKMQPALERALRHKGLLHA